MSAIIGGGYAESKPYKEKIASNTNWKGHSEQDGGTITYDWTSNFAFDQGNSRGPAGRVNFESEWKLKGSA